MAKKPYEVTESFLYWLPLKSRLLYNFKMNGDMWCTDATVELLDQSHMKHSERWIYCIRYYMTEMDINGMLESVDMRIADEDFYGQPDMIENKYHLTELGLERINKILRCD